MMSEPGRFGSTGMVGRDDWDFWSRFLVLLVADNVFFVFVADGVFDDVVVRGVVVDFWGDDFKFVTFVEILLVIFGGFRAIFVDVVDGDGVGFGIWFDRNFRGFGVFDNVGQIVVAHGAADFDNVGGEAINDWGRNFKFVARFEIAGVWLVGLGFVVGVDVADVDLMSGGFLGAGIGDGVVVVGETGGAVHASIVADEAGHGAGVFGSFAEVAEVDSVAGLTIRGHANWRDEVETFSGVGGRGDFERLPRIGIFRSESVFESRAVERKVTLLGAVLGLFVDVSGETFEVESVFRVAVSDAGVELDDVAGAVFDFTDDFGP